MVDARSKEQRYSKFTPRSASFSLVASNARRELPKYYNGRKLSDEDEYGFKFPGWKYELILI